MGDEAPDEKRRLGSAVPVDSEDQKGVALLALKEAAIAWAATGYGRPLVDAAADALAAGIDSPNLRMLAGAAARFADEEAAEYGPATFEELDLDIAEKHSQGACHALARLKAQRFLAGEGSARSFAAELWQLYVRADYSAELAEFSGLDDWYALLDDGVIDVDTAVVDRAVREAAEHLVDGVPGASRSLDRVFLGSECPRPRAITRPWSVLRKIRNVG